MDVVDDCRGTWQTSADCDVDRVLGRRSAAPAAADLPSVMGVSLRPADVVDGCGVMWRTSAVLSDEHYGVQTCNNQPDKKRKSGGMRGNVATRGRDSGRGRGGMRIIDATTSRTRGARAEEREATAQREAEALAGDATG